jgi:hypothetical protein
MVVILLVCGSGNRLLGLVTTLDLRVQRSRFEVRSFQIRVISVVAAVTRSVCFYTSGYHNILTRSHKHDFGYLTQRPLARRLRLVDT